MKKRILALLALALLAAFCGRASAKDVLVAIDQYDATTMDPIAHNDLPSWRACYSIYDTLIFMSDEGEVSPALATSWEFLSDTEYKFSLRKGVKFHNGEEMKADDVKFSIDRAIGDKGAMVRIYTQNVKEVEAVDDYTIIIRLKKVDHSFFASLSHGWSSVVNRKAVEAAGDNYGMNPVGTGPFKFESWHKGNKYVFTRFDDFWGGKAKYKTLEVRSVPETTSRTIELESGGADIAYPIASIDLKRIEENPKLALYRKSQSSFGYLGFNTTKAPFDNPKVRRAIYDALDTEGIHKAVWRGVGHVPRSVIPQTVKYSISKELPPHKQDVELAKKALAEEGVKDLKIEIWTNERKERIDMATIIQAQLAEVGIASEIKVVEWGAYLNGLSEKKHDVFMLAWVATVPDPEFAVSAILQSGSGSNYTYFSDPKMDEMLDAGRSIKDGPERQKIYEDIQNYANEQVPLLFLYNDESIAGTQKNVKGLDVRANEVHSFRDVYFED